MLKAGEVTKDLVAQRVARAFRRYVGRGREHDYRAFAELVDTDQRTVESWCRGETAPHLHAWLRCAAVLPASFATETLELVGLMAWQADAEHATSLTVNRLAAALTALIGLHAEDGVITHREMADQEPVIRALVDECARWLARRAGAPPGDVRVGEGA